VGNVLYIPLNLIMIPKSFLALSVMNCRYMRGRLTLEKVNAAINDMATYAEANAQLMTAPKKKVLISLCF
jgi:hypothetical protein